MPPAPAESSVKTEEKSDWIWLRMDGTVRRTRASVDSSKTHANGPTQQQCRVTQIAGYSRTQVQGGGALS